MARQLAATGQTHSLNPIWLFLNGFNYVYLRITQGASRLQELLADRDAARAYGVQSVADALTYIAHQSLVFHLQVSREVELSHGLRRTLQNLYTLPDLPPDALQERLEQQLEQLFSHPTSPYDSHPAVRERLDRLRRLAPADPPPESREPALNLLPTAEALQSEMTALIQDNVRRLQLYNLS
jgi:Zn-dependent protease with chaperone function